VSVSAKSLKPVERDRVRAALRLLDQKHQPQTELARLLGVTQQTVSSALGEGSIGVKVAHAVAKLSGQTYEELLAGAPRPRSYSDLPGWDDAAQSVIEERLAPRFAVQAVGMWPVTVQVTRAEAQLVIELADFWKRWAPLEARIAATTENDARDLEREVGERASKIRPASVLRGQKRS
jgi:hypothetical protein